MRLLTLSFKNILAKPLSSFLSVLLFGFGVGVIVLILLTSSLLKEEINKNASGIDLVVGAKGSPLQIILCSIFHIDFPTGNISLKDADKLSKNRLITSAIPMSLGDSYQGYRIVGTTIDYANQYQAQLQSGDWFEEGMTATLGANVAERLGIKVEDKFTGGHGLAEGGTNHDEHPYEVAGIMKPTGTVIDNLILVSIQSVWAVHGHEAEEHHDHEEGSDLHELVTLKRLGVTVTKEQLEEEQVTSILVKYRSPMAALQLPRIVNNTSNLQAASPPFETTRLFSIIGVGVEVANVLGLVIIIISALSVFIALINSLKERKYELAIMRSMGASKLKLFFLVLAEGFILTLTGSFIGFAMAHGGVSLLVGSLEQFQTSGFVFVNEEYLVLGSSFLVGIFAAIVPAIMAYNSDISSTLAKG